MMVGPALAGLRLVGIKQRRSNFARKTFRKVGVASNAAWASDTETAETAGTAAADAAALTIWLAGAQAADDPEAPPEALAISPLGMQLPAHTMRKIEMGWLQKLGSGNKSCVREHVAS